MKTINMLNTLALINVHGIELEHRVSLGEKASLDF